MSGSQRLSRRDFLRTTAVAGAGLGLTATTSIGVAQEEKVVNMVGWGGDVPPDAERLAVDGGDAADRAWRRGGDLLLLTRAHLLSPGPLAAERGPGGRWAYRLPDTPLALVSAGGRERRLAFAGAGVETDRREAENEH